jgi:hypothetical protein
LTKSVYGPYARPFISLAAICLVALFAIPAAAQATDPAGDQYAPTVPGGGGSVPSTDVDLDPAGQNGGNGSDGGDAAAPASSPTSTTAPSDADGTSQTAAGDGTSSGGDGQRGSADDETDRALANLARIAADERKAQPASSSSVLSAGGGGDDGLGPFLWVALGATLLWAVGMGIVRHRQGGGA